MRHSVLHLSPQGEVARSAGEVFEESHKGSDSLHLSPQGEVARSAGEGAVLRCIARSVCSLFALLASLPALAATINGTVFEDVNYGGGAGRPLTTTGVLRSDGARVELYRPDGVYRASTTTNASGQFSFTVNPNTWGTGQYYVRVVNGTVISERSGCNGSPRVCVPVQTFRTNAGTLSGTGTNTAIAVTNQVGGQDPGVVDAPSNSSLSITQLTSSGQTAQSVARVNLQSNSATVNGVDFGFNFDTIVNTRDITNCDASSGTTFFPCQGTLRQFIINSNALGGEGSLAQSGSGQFEGLNSALPSARETSIFMIPSAALTSGVATITLAGALPAISGTATGTRLDATTQTVNMGDSNAGTLGTGGAVGVNSTSLPLFQRPEVELRSGNRQIVLSGASQSIVGFALPQGYILLSGADGIARNNLVGMHASGVTNDAGNPENATSYGITYTGGNAIVRSNYVTVNNSGIRGENAQAGAQISFNEVARPAAGHTTTYDGILIIGSASNVQVSNNLARDQRGAGLEIGFTGGSMSGVTVSNNTIQRNGYPSTTFTTASTEPTGIAAWNYSGSGVEISLNVIENNAGPGVMISSANARISQNRFSSNGGLSVDLYSTSTDPNSMGPGAGPTLNDTNDTDGGANGLLNFPVITAATLVNGQFSIAGFARPGSVIELYLAQPDPSGFGEGLTYVGTFTEGVADLDGTTGPYSGSINGLNQGDDNTSRFLFRGTAPAGVGGGIVLTSTATLGGVTSEFGGNVTVSAGPNLVHVKTVAVDSDPFNNTSNPKSIPGALQLYTVRITNQGTGVVDSNTLEIVDAIPANTALCGLDGAPIAFTDGSPVSGLTFAFAALNSTTDDVDFSNSTTGSPAWTYTPQPTAGCDPAVTYIRVRPRGTMAAGGAGGNPYFEIRFRARIN